MIDAQLRRWKTDPDSAYYQVLYKWSGGREVSYRLSTPMIWGMVGTFGALLIALFFGFLLKRRVRRVTADLQNSRDELNTILDGVGAHVYIKDAELRYQYANKATQELWGKPLADIKGKKTQTSLMTKRPSEFLKTTNRCCPVESAWWWKSSTPCAAPRA